jgi:uroporphyrinogen-III decarboxylase
MMKGLLQGNPQSRPLVVPIVFSLGAKVENFSLRAYLDNPTKISNALRQIRTSLRTDGVSCYFDPLLEIEALGGTPQWDSANQIRTIHWPESTRKGELPPRLRSPEDAANSPRAKVAVEVIRRLNSTMRDEPLLMAGVSGPFTLAARLTELDTGEIRYGEEPSESAVGVAAAAITKIASVFVEAGANLIFVREDILPRLTSDKCQSWASLLAPVFNIIRFYEALPVLQIATEAATAENIEAILQQPWDAVLCSASQEFATRAGSRAENSAFGLALPTEIVAPNSSCGPIDPELSNLTPALLTTDGDIPVTTDLKHVMKTFDSIARQMSASWRNR